MKGRAIEYSMYELVWIEVRKDLPRRELHRKFCETFDRDDVSLDCLKALCTRNGWKTGRTGCFATGQTPHNKGKPHRTPGSEKTQFKAGNLPHNTNYLGHERLSKEGYVEVSVDERNPHTGYERRYVLKHRWLWEKANGPLPDGMVLKNLDGDKTNTDPANWEAIPRALLPRLNGRYGRGYDTAPDEIKPTIMAITKLEHKARSVLRGE